MEMELEAAKKANLDWSVKVFCPYKAGEISRLFEFSKLAQAKTGKSSYWNRVCSVLKLSHEYHSWLLSKEREVDIFVLRYHPHDLFQLCFLKKTRKPVYFVHHTLEVPELYSSRNVTGIIKGLVEKVMGKRAIIKSKATIGVTSEIIEYEINRTRQQNRKTILYPNGILISESIPKDKRGSVPEILFVANHFQIWQGLDLLLESIEKSKSVFTLHLVGNIPSKEMERLQKEPRIILHGKLTAAQIQSLSESSWVGLSSLALYRKQMAEASTLKVREYLNNGLPAYAAYRETLPINFPYYKQGNPDIAQILNYCNEMRNVSRSDVRNAAAPYIDKAILLNRLKDEIVKFEELTSVTPLSFSP